MRRGRADRRARQRQKAGADACERALAGHLVIALQEALIDRLGRFGVCLQRIEPDLVEIAGDEFAAKGAECAFLRVETSSEGIGFNPRLGGGALHLLGDAGVYRGFFLLGLLQGGVGRSIAVFEIRDTLTDDSFLRAEFAHAVGAAVERRDRLSLVGNAVELLILRALLGILRAGLQERGLDDRDLLFGEARALDCHEVAGRTIGLRRSLFLLHFDLQLVEPVLEPGIGFLGGVVAGFGQRLQVDVGKAIGHFRGALGRLGGDRHLDHIAEPAAANIDGFRYCGDHAVSDLRGRRGG